MEEFVIYWLHKGQYAVHWKMLFGKIGRKITFREPISCKILKCISLHCMIQNLFWLMCYSTWSSEEQIVFYSLSYMAVHCSKVLKFRYFSDHCLKSAATSLRFNAFLSILCDSATFQKCWVIISFSPYSRCTVLYIGIFFFTISGWECKGVGWGLCSSTFVFMWSKLRRCFTVVYQQKVVVSLLTEWDFTWCYKWSGGLEVLKCLNHSNN